MIDLDDQLTAFDRFLDDASPVQPLDGLLVEPSVTTPLISRRRWLTVAAAGVAAVAGGGAITAVLRGRPNPNASLPPLPEWRLVHEVLLPAPEPGVLPTEGPFCFLSSVAETGDGLIAVGFQRVLREETPIVLTSADGLTWALAGQPEFSSGEQPMGITTFRGRQLLATGGDDGTTVWVGTDGDWEAVQLDDRGLISSPLLAATDSTAVIVHSDRPDLAGREQRAMFSADGTTWTSSELPDERMTVTDVNVLDGRFVAVGEVRGQAAMWESPDGRAWRRAELPGATGTVSSWLSGAAALGDITVVMGVHGSASAQVGTQDPAHPSVHGWLQPMGWRSIDGGPWESFTLGERLDEVHQSAGPVTVVAGRIVVLVNVISSEGASAKQYTSVDGVEWHESEVPLVGYVSDILPFGEGAIALTGRTLADEDRLAAIWALAP